MARGPLSRRATISMGAKGRSACFRSRGSKTIRIGCAIRLEVAIIVSGLIREKKKKKIFGRKRRTLRLIPRGFFSPSRTRSNLPMLAVLSRVVATVRSISCLRWLREGGFGVADEVGAVGAEEELERARFWRCWRSFLAIRALRASRRSFSGLAFVSVSKRC